MYITSCELLRNKMCYPRVNNCYTSTVIYKLFLMFVISKVIYGCFSRFINCTNGTKSLKVSHMCSAFPKRKKAAPLDIKTSPVLISDNMKFAKLLNLFPRRENSLIMTLPI